MNQTLSVQPTVQSVFLSSPSACRTTGASKNQDWTNENGDHLSFVTLALLGVAWCCMVLLGVAWYCLELLGVAWCCLDFTMYRNLKFCICFARESMKKIPLNCRNFKLCFMKIADRVTWLIYNDFVSFFVYCAAGWLLQKCKLKFFFFFRAPAYSSDTITGGPFLDTLCLNALTVAVE